jgi:hypothetical protein
VEVSNEGTASEAGEKTEFFEGDGLQAVHNCFVVNAALAAEGAIFSSTETLSAACLAVPKMRCIRPGFNRRDTFIEMESRTPGAKKPSSIAARGGTAEAVPFVGTDHRLRSCRSKFCTGSNKIQGPFFPSGNQTS